MNSLARNQHSSPSALVKSQSHLYLAWNHQLSLRKSGLLWPAEQSIIGSNVESIAKYICWVEIVCNVRLATLTSCRVRLNYCSNLNWPASELICEECSRNHSEIYVVHNGGSIFKISLRDGSESVVWGLTSPQETFVAKAVLSACGWKRSSLAIHL